MSLLLLIRVTNWAPNMSQELTSVLCTNGISPNLVHTNPYFQDGEDEAQGTTVSLGQSQDASRACLSPHAGVLPPHGAASLLTHPTAYGNVTFALQIFFYIDIYSLSYLQFLTKKKKNNSHPDQGLMSCGLSAFSPISCIFNPASCQSPPPPWPLILAEPALWTAAQSHLVKYG